MSLGDAQDLAKITGLSTLGADAHEEAINATVEKVRNTRANGLEAEVERDLKQLAFNSWTEAGVADPAALWSTTDPPPPKETSSNGEDRDSTQAQKLLALASRADLWHSPDMVTYATLDVGSHREHHRVRSLLIRRWLQKQFYEQEGKPPSATALDNAIGVLEARAHFDGPQLEVAVRTAEQDGCVYIDLCDDEWRAVEVDADGWRIRVDPPVRFTRARGMAPLPEPAPGGSRELFQSWINVVDEDLILVLGWLVCSLHPVGPYPVLILQGEQGSAKSTTARVIRRLVDPSTATLRAAPREERDLIVAALNSRVLAFDNLSKVSSWLSDALCRLATGGGFSTRQLYTDTDEVLFQGQRPVILNGIEELAEREDLRDRAVIIHLPEITEDARRPEKEFWDEFEEGRPAMLGLLLDALSAALNRYEEVSLSRLPRMADFTRMATAAEVRLGYDHGAFESAYARNRQQALQQSAEFNPIVQAVLALVGGDTWSGTATQLLDDLNDRVGEEQRRRKDWPRSARGMSNALDRAAPALRRLGIEILRSRDAKQRVITLTKGRRAQQVQGATVTTVTSVMPPDVAKSGAAPTHDADDASDANDDGILPPLLDDPAAEGRQREMEL